MTPRRGVTRCPAACELDQHFRHTCLLVVATTKTNVAAVHRVHSLILSQPWRLSGAMAPCQGCARHSWTNSSALSARLPTRRKRPASRRTAVQRQAHDRFTASDLEHLRRCATLARAACVLAAALAADAAVATRSAEAYGVREGPGEWAPRRHHRHMGEHRAPPQFEVRMWSWCMLLRTCMLLLTSTKVPVVCTLCV